MIKKTFSPKPWFSTKIPGISWVCSNFSIIANASRVEQCNTPSTSFSVMVFWERAQTTNFSMDGRARTTSDPFRSFSYSCALILMGLPTNSSHSFLTINGIVSLSLTLLSFFNVFSLCRGAAAKVLARSLSLRFLISLCFSFLVNPTREGSSFSSSSSRYSAWLWSSALPASSIWLLPSSTPFPIRAASLPLNLFLFAFRFFNILSARLRVARSAVPRRYASRSFSSSASGLSPFKFSSELSFDEEGDWRTN